MIYSLLIPTNDLHEVELMGCSFEPMQGIVGAFQKAHSLAVLIWKRAGKCLFLAWMKAWDADMSGDSSFPSFENQAHSGKIQSRTKKICIDPLHRSIFAPERWQSGRLRQSWKLLMWKHPGVRIPLSPPKIWIPLLRDFFCLVSRLQQWNANYYR